MIDIIQSALIALVALALLHHVWWCHVRRDR